MKLKYIFKLFSAFVFIVTLNSCNESNTEYTTSALSADAQVYSFKLAATPKNAIDSINYPVLGKTKFAIDQFRSLIYNPDSLPYKTDLKKFAATITYASPAPSKLQLIYPKDSIVEWNGTDSIDFSTRLYPKLKITAANGSAGDSKEYTIELRVHKIDPDTLVWTKINIEQPATIGKQKTILKNNTFHTFSIDKDGGFSLYTADKNSMIWSGKKSIDGELTASNVVLESITLFNGIFYAIDNVQKAYSSEDGIIWTVQNTNVHGILGVLPNTTASKDSLLIITKELGKLYFAKTEDMKAIRVVSNVSNNPSDNTVVSEFPVTGFSSVTNYNRLNLNSNNLIVTGGKNSNGTLTNLTWLLRMGNDRLEVISNQTNNVFGAKNGISTFLYDGQLFALTQNTLYKSISWGYKWTIAPSKERLDPTMPKASEQSIIVDNDNYIWVFGGITDTGASAINQVWKGRLNRLNSQVKN